MKRRGLVDGAIVLGTVIGLGVWHGWSTRQSRLEYSGTVETREIQAGSKVGGRVTEVPVEEGQFVKAGQVLVLFEANDLTARRAEAAAQAQQAQAMLERLLHGNRPEEIAQANAAAEAQRAQMHAAQAGPRKQEIDQARADYSSAQADAANADTYFQRMQQLVQKDVISRQQFDDARDKRDAAQGRAKAAQQRLALLEAGTRAEELEAAEARYQQARAAAELARKGSRKEDIAGARAQLAAAKAAIANIEVSLREAELTAPADGLVEVVSVRPGDLVPPGRIVITMLEPSQLWVKAYVPETDLARVHVGQPATIRIDGTTQSFNGHVGMVSSQAEFLPRNVQTSDDRQHQVFGVKVYVDNAAGVLKSGMAATVTLQ